MATVEIGSDAKPGLGLSGAGIVEDFLVRVQWFASPVSRDFRKQTMLDGIPLGSARWVVGNGEGEAEGVGQLRLELGFPGTAAIAVAATGVAQNEDLAGAWVTE